MRARSAVIIALLLIAVPFAGALPGPGRTGASRDAAKAADDKFDAAPGKEDALTRGEAKGFFAKWQKDGPRIYGRFVNFNVTDGGTMSDFSYTNGSGTYRKIFTSVAIADFTKDATAPNGGVRVTGSIMRVVATDALLRMHNNPTAGVKLQNGDVARDVTFLLAAGNTAGNLSESNRSLALSLAGFAGTTHGHIVVSNGSIEKLTGSVKVHLAKNATLSFVVHPKSANANLLHALNSALAKGRLGAQAHVIVVNGAPVVQTDDVDVSIVAGAMSSKKASFNATGAPGTGPRVVVITLDRADFPDLKNGSIEVKIGGVKVPALVADVAVGATSAAAANVTIGKDTITIVVNVPHFSTEEVVVQSAEPTGTGGTTNPPASDGGKSGIPGFAPIAALAALAAVAIVLRRRG